MQTFEIILIVIIVILAIVIFYLFQRILKITTKYEEKIKSLMIEHEKDKRESIQKSVGRSRNTIKGQIAERLAPILPGFPYLPSDCRFIGNPIDYLVIKGYTEYSNNPSEQLEIVIVEIKSNKSNLSNIQKAIANAIAEKRVKFEVVVVNDKGEISVQPTPAEPRSTTTQSSVQENSELSDDKDDNG